MIKLKNTSRNILIYLCSGNQINFAYNEEKIVQDDFKEVIKSQLDGLVEVPMPKEMVSNYRGKRVPKEEKVSKKEPEVKIEPPVEDQSVEEDKKPLTKEENKIELEKMSFIELKKLGKRFDPPVTDRSKSKLIEELLVRIYED